MIGWPRLSVLGTLFGALCIWFAGLDFPVLAPWPRLSGSVLVVSASWPWFSDSDFSRLGSRVSALSGPSRWILALWSWSPDFDPLVLLSWPCLTDLAFLVLTFWPGFSDL